jgi:iron complex outermembrane receptor protein
LPHKFSKKISKEDKIMNGYRRNRAIFLMGTFTSSLLFAAPAFAAAPGETTEPYSATSALEEITVTARKREEGLQNAPISISAYTGEGLEYRGVTKIDSLASFTPNLVYQSNPGDGGSSASAAIYIRGIGQSDFVPTVEPGVGLYVDGVYIARSVGAILDLVDVERVEVLRGPQGTLFGRNTIGGAISVTSKKPDEKLAGSAEVTTGSANRIDAKASVNVPITDKFFTRLSAGTFNRDGYVSRPFDGKDLGNVKTLTGRAAFRLLASENFEINLSFDGTRDRNNGAPMVTTALIMPGQPGYLSTFMALNNVLVLGDPFSCFAPANLNTPGCYNTNVIQGDKNINGGTAAQFSNLDIWGASLILDLKLGNVAAKSITAYRDLNSKFARDIDESPERIGHVWDSLKQHQFSQEFQLVGNSFDNRLNWVAGLYYLKEKADNLNLLEFTIADFNSGGKVDSQSWAGFGQATYAITNALKLTAGLRYTEDKKSFSPDQYITQVNVPSFIFPFPVGTEILPHVTATNKIHSVTPMANLSYQWAEELMTYVSYSEGFKSGGFTQRVFPPEPTIPSFNPEFVKVFEGGFKLTGLNKRLKLNGAVFYTKYNDLQIPVTNTTRVGPFITNAAKAEVKGAELELSAAPGDGWLFEGSVGYVDPKYKELDQGAIGLTLNSKFSLVSDWTLSGSVSKDVLIGNYGRLIPRVDWAYRSSFFTNSANSPEIEQKGYHTVNASLAWHAPEEHFQLVAGVTNLTNKRYMITGYLQPNFGNFESMFARKRQWYVTGRYNF